MITAVSFPKDINRRIPNDPYIVESSIQWFITRTFTATTFASTDISFTRSSSFGIEKNLSRTNSSSSRTTHPSKKTNEKSLHLTIRFRSTKIFIFSKRNDFFERQKKIKPHVDKTERFNYLFRSLVWMKSIDALMLHMQIIIQ